MARNYFLILGALLALVAISFVLGALQISTSTSRADEIVRQTTGESFETIRNSYDDIESRLIASARQLAESGVVVDGLRNLDSNGAAGAPLVRFFSSLQPGDRQSIELYTIEPRLVAWNGFSMPLDAAPSSDQFLDSYQLAIATDADKRKALVAWYPVRDGLRVLGAVRAMLLIEFDAPVQNQFLKDYSWTSKWRRLTSSRITYHSDSAPETSEDRMLLRSSDGSILGELEIQHRDFDNIKRELQVRAFDVTAFFIVLCMAWFLVGLAYWLRYNDYSWLTFMLLAVALALARWALMALDVPGRYQTGRAPLSPLFDPSHLASEFGFGLMRSAGDFLISALFGLVFSFVVARVLGRRATAIRNHERSLFHRVAVAAVGFALVFELVFLLAKTSQRVVVDSTLNLFALSGLLPSPLALLVFAATLIVALCVVITSSAIIRYVSITLGGARRASWRSVLFALAIAVGWVFARLNLTAYQHPTGLLLIIFISLVLLAALGATYKGSWTAALTIRNVLPAIFILAALVYPFLYKGLDLQTRSTMVDAVESFDQGRDARTVFALERSLVAAAEDEAILAALDPATNVNVDSVAAAFLVQSFAISIDQYNLSLVLATNDGEIRGRFYESPLIVATSQLRSQETEDFSIAVAMYEEKGADEPLVELVTGTKERDRFVYQGIARARNPDGSGAGSILIKAEPRLYVAQGTTPFPKVLVPSSVVSGFDRNISLAEFRDEFLVRSTGQNFGRYRLDPDVKTELDTAEEHWQRENIKGKLYLTYYRRTVDDTRDILPASVGSSTSIPVVAARVPAINIFDHLYFLLRITVAGIFLAIPAFIMGLFVQMHVRRDDASRVKFRNKVLNAFFAVGIATVTAMAVVGVNVITGENDRAVQSWLRQHLERVEATLAQESVTGELPYRALERVEVDSLASQVGLDLNIYRGTALEQSSRPQLIRDRLISERLPMAVYQSLYLDGFRFASTSERLGSFSYTAGYRAFPDESGRPRYVVSVPTLPEQERIEEERARTVAYLFGSLLLLVLVVMITASLLANALTRPIGRLREGLEKVAKGRFERIPSLETRDEIGELVDSFNTMQDELADSQQKLARQERELAWQEMARQVAHEIKNPLTPMKLSIQHLRRAFGDSRHTASEEFSQMFDRVTTTLTEQVDALARIANEFSSFGRMPKRELDRVEMNAVLRGAAELMRAEVNATISLDQAQTELVVSADKQELRRVVINLIKNGIQAVPEGRDGKIEIRTSREEADGVPFVRVEISDNGSGIPDDIRPRIFEPNFSTKTSGTGLGLAIVHKTVEELGGSIDFSTEAGSGTTFFFLLPLLSE